MCYAFGLLYSKPSGRVTLQNNETFELCSFFVLVGFTSGCIKSRAHLLWAPVKPIILTVWFVGLELGVLGMVVKTSDQVVRSQGLLLDLSENIEAEILSHSGLQMEKQNKNSIVVHNV